MTLPLLNDCGQGWKLLLLNVCSRRCFIRQEKKTFYWTCSVWAAFEKVFLSAVSCKAEAPTTIWCRDPAKFSQSEFIWDRSKDNGIVFCGQMSQQYCLILRKNRLWVRWQENPDGWRPKVGKETSVLVQGHVQFVVKRNFFLCSCPFYTQSWYWSTTSDDDGSFL